MVLVPKIIVYAQKVNALGRHAASLVDLLQIMKDNPFGRQGLKGNLR